MPKTENPPVWINGVVKAVSIKDNMPMGILLEGREGWLNESKFADVPIMPPDKGMPVALLVKDDRYIVQLIPRNGEIPFDTAEEDEAAKKPAWTFADKDRLIAREVALKAAVDFLSKFTQAEEPITARDVVYVAGVFAGFLEGESDPE
jgi:hypothetical protein